MSHRWEARLKPDPDGVQLDAILAHLDAHPEVTHVWYDYACMPLLRAPDAPPTSQPPSTAGAASSADGSSASSAEGSAGGDDGAPLLLPPGFAADDEDGGEAAHGALRDEMARSLAAAPLLFLSAHCLLLVDSASQTRFWPCFEAWLALKRPWSEGGLLDHDDPRARCTIQLMRDEPDFMATLLVETWRAKDAAAAFARLGAETPATFAADKAAQLRQVTSLHRYLEMEPRLVAAAAAAAEAEAAAAAAAAAAPPAAAPAEVEQKAAPAAAPKKKKKK